MSRPTTDRTSRLLTVEEVADVLRTSTKTVRRRISVGDLPCIRDGRLVRVLADDLERYLAAHRSTRSR